MRLSPGHLFASLDGTETKTEISECIDHLRATAAVTRHPDIRASIGRRIDVLLDCWDTAPAGESGEWHHPGRVTESSDGSWME